MSDPQKVTPMELYIHPDFPNGVKTLIEAHNSEIRALQAENAELKAENTLLQSKVARMFGSDTVQQLQAERDAARKKLRAHENVLLSYCFCEEMSGVDGEKSRVTCEFHEALDAELRAADKPARAHGIPTERKCAICEG